MKKIIEIESCHYCKHCEQHRRFGARNKCQKKDRAIINIHEIPPWCPLKDAEEHNYDCNSCETFASTARAKIYKQIKEELNDKLTEYKHILIVPKKDWDNYWNDRGVK